MLMGLRICVGFGARGAAHAAHATWGAVPCSRNGKQDDPDALAASPGRMVACISVVPRKEARMYCLFIACMHE